MTLEQQALIERALSRKNLDREEQRRLGLEFRDALTLNTYQANVIREIGSVQRIARGMSYEI